MTILRTAAIAALTLSLGACGTVQTVRERLVRAPARCVDQTVQIYFDADSAEELKPVIDWLADLRRSGIDAPVRLGVPGPASAATLMRFAARCGVAASGAVLARYGLSLAKLVQSTGPDKYISELVAGLDPAVHGEVGLHFYPFGGLAATAQWIERFGRLAGH